jgi:hypothetical protein
MTVRVIKISKDKILKDYFKGYVSEAVFDKMLKKFPGLFREVETGIFDAHYLPKLDARLMSVYTEMKREVEAEQAVKAKSAAEKMETEIQRRVVQAMAKEEAKMLKNASRVLLKLQAGDAQDT